jgi:hypothetical protein
VRDVSQLNSIQMSVSLNCHVVRGKRARFVQPLG